MRKLVIAIGVVLVAVFAVGTAAARPYAGAPLVLPLSGTFSTLESKVPFAGALTVDRFGVVDAQLVVEGELSANDGLFEPVAVAVVAVAAPEADPATGDCTVQLGLVNTIPVADGVLQLTDPIYQFGGPESGLDLCGVLRAATIHPGDQEAIARALNRAFGLGMGRSVA
jgi:hypothetical protein